jgi:VWFA-related protein
MIQPLKAGLCFGLLFAASLSPALAEQPVAQPAASPSVSSPAAGESMQLYLVVHDKHDRPVLDLKPEELALTDDGSPAKLDNLQLVNSRKPATNLVTFVFDSFPPQKDAHPKKPSAKIENARDAALKILSLLNESGFQFSVFNIDSRLHLQQGFTSDLTAVETAINAVTGPAAARDKKSAAKAEKDLISVALSGVDASGRPVAARERLLAQSSYAALRNATRIAQDRRISPSLASLTALVQAQQDINQRKTILYLSAMDQATINDIARQAINSIIGSANQAGVNIDVVDCLSLGPHGSRIKMLDPNSQGALVALNTLQMAGGSISIPPDAGDLEVTEDAPVNADLQRLAVATGGTYLNGDGQRKSLQQITDDMTSYYQASFVPRMNGYDGKFHPLVVKPIRTGLKIRTQTGYLALPPPAADGSRPEPFELPLLKLLSQAPLPAQLPFRAAVLDLGSSADGSRGVLAIELPVANLSVERDANSSSSLAHVTMIAEIKDQTGAVAAHFSSNAPERFTLRSGAAGSAQVLSLQRHFILPPGKYTLQVLLVDTASGKAGAQSILFEISTNTAAPSLSNLVLVRRADPVPANDDGAGDPLFTGKTRVTPNISGSLPSGDTNAAIFFAAHIDTQSSQPARLQISVLHDGNILGGKPAIDRQINGEEYFTYLTSLGINHPTDGAYQIEALLTQGGKTATSFANFTLSGTASADDDPPGSSPSLESVARPAGPLDITVSANPDLRPPAEELKSLLADAAQYANNYWDSLPNFTCEDVTERFVGSAGSSKWEHTDTLTGELTYYDHQEDWQFRESEKHHRKSHDSASDSEKGISSAGIFGSVIRGLFRPASKAEIEWTESGTLRGGVVQVFKYRVARENSNLSLRVGPTEVITVGYHGMVYIDSATHSVRRITESADDVPRTFPIRAALLTADYDYVAIGGQQYLVPIGAQVILRKGRHEMDLNQIRFRNFHRFRSSAKILSVEPETQH